MNKKGFTLIELLGVIVILSIIMLIAIPNVMSVFENTKRQTYLADATKFVTQVEYELRKGSINKPTSDDIYKVTLGYIGTADVSKDADNNSYDLDKSYVVVVRNNGYLEYYISLIANLSNGDTKGISLTSSDNLKSDDKLSLITNNPVVRDNDYIKSLTGKTNITEYKK